MMSEKCTFKLLSEPSEWHWHWVTDSSNRQTAGRFKPVQLPPETIMHNKLPFVAVVRRPVFRLLVYGYVHLLAVLLNILSTVLLRSPASRVATCTLRPCKATRGRHYTLFMRMKQWQAEFILFICQEWPWKTLSGTHMWNETETKLK